MIGGDVTVTSEHRQGLGFHGASARSCGLSRRFKTSACWAGLVSTAIGEHVAAITASSLSFGPASIIAGVAVSTSANLGFQHVEQLGKSLFGEGQKQLGRFYNYLESEIYSVYGMSRYR
jgi:hypothetical protein